jgi:hypothetical protein
MSSPSCSEALCDFNSTEEEVHKEAVNPSYNDEVNGRVSGFYTVGVNLVFSTQRGEETGLPAESAQQGSILVLDH